MSVPVVRLLSRLFGCLLLATSLLAEHRATRLGNPATRFADPLVSADDLRWRFRDPALRKDIIEVLRQWGWKGRLDDLFAAAETAEITPYSIAVGERLPFMSTREKGRPICLFDVVWDGKEPTPAFTFTFSSLGRRYRCITPKACSNFLLVDLGIEPKPTLSVDCSVRDQFLLKRPIRICFTARNTGDGPEPHATLRLPPPQGLTASEIGDNGRIDADGSILWDLGSLAPTAQREVCVTFQTDRTGPVPFSATLRGERAAESKTACNTRVIGVPAILLEVIDLEDPIEVGGQVQYVIRVVNQGTAPGTHVRIRCTLPDSQEFLAGSGATDVKFENGILTLAPLPSLEPKATAEWRISVKAVREDDARFQTELTSDQFESPIRENESTRQY